VRADLRELPFLEIRIALEEGPRDCELEHAVAEELEPFVRQQPVLRTGRVREDLIGALLRKLRDQPREVGGLPTGAT
jgi:hypothetical protein